MELRTDSLNDLPAAAEALLQADPAARHFAFYGGMGAGKTTFIKALCQVLGVRETVTSPTFALVNEYHTAQGQSVYHFDFYRIRKVEELYDLGCGEYFDEEDAYCMIEWPGLAEEVLPEDTVCVRIEQLDDGGRLLSF
ncbi:MAG: tRNA (adenosine(37)-N6)-threonylcarbamoyltransferase complex ATPase subunit type 1 TsaE [Bacteroidales bacterium]|nr:tRNA (adenosine(37)-N6)-threonylcarbamoyltransferase complex ATPase subunit type 1 TsaE [Bacteroidales bacterium]